MANFFRGLFGGAKQTQQPATALRINSSLQGTAIAICLGGQNRMAGNVIDYFGLTYKKVQQGGGGKGGAGKGSGTDLYTASFLMAVCEGPIDYFGQIWLNGSPVGEAAPGQPNYIPVNQPGQAFEPAVFETFIGTYPQDPWGFTEATNPPLFGGAGAGQSAHILGYSGIAYFGWENFPLGSTPSLPNITVEVLSTNNDFLPNSASVGTPDGDPSVAVTSFLSDAHFGLGFPSTRVAALSGTADSYQSYCLANGFAVSPIIASSIQASSWIDDMAKATNSAPCWQDGLWSLIPYGDSPLTAGTVTTVTEERVVPSVPAGQTPTITVGHAGTFAGDGGVAYQAGGALTKVLVFQPTGQVGSGSPSTGQYYGQGGIYYFNRGDANATVEITYSYAVAGSYFPNTTPLYDFTIDDFMPMKGSIGTGMAIGNSPLVVVRKSRDQMVNVLRLTYLDRNNSYNPTTIEIKDEAKIQTFKRERPSDLKQFDFFCLASAAQQSAMLQLIRQQIPRTFQWTCGRHFLLILELMALATVTDSGQGLNRQAVRIIEIQENSDFSLTITAEEYMGTVSAPQYGTQANSGFSPNYNEDPGGINAPIIFEPTAELAETNGDGGLQVWVALSGADMTKWGGAYVWASYDGSDYGRSPIGKVTSAASMGITTSTLANVTPNPTGGLTIDQFNTFGVDLTESDASIGSTTTQNAQAGNSRCYVGGEVLAYATATLTATSKYTLSYLVRGLYDSTIASHVSGVPFCVLDGRIFNIPYDKSRVGATLYLKFQSFNIFGAGIQNLANVTAVKYIITGAALSSPLPNVTNLRSRYDVDTGFIDLDWDEVIDFRQDVYEVRSGTGSAAASMTLGTVAHPPFRVPGDGTYWIAARSQPVPGLIVYSQAWEDIVIAGAVITKNIIKTIDLKSVNWPGTFTGGAGVDNSLNAIRTGGGNILTDPNILTTTDILNYGGGSSGMYFPNDTFLDVGYVANVSISMKYIPTGIPVGQNILTVGDILTDPDVLGAAATQFVDVFPLINYGTSAGGDLYAVGDLYDPTGWYPGVDLYELTITNWIGFQKFSPGTYQGRFFDFGMSLSTVDPNTIAYCLAWVITCTIPARIDQYAVTTSSGADSTVTFGQAGVVSTAPLIGTASPYNGGAGAGNLPMPTWSIGNAQAGDDLIITALSLTAISFKILNGGSRVVRNINLFMTGF